MEKPRTILDELGQGGSGYRKWGWGARKQQGCAKILCHSCHSPHSYASRSIPVTMVTSPREYSLLKKEGQNLILCTYMSPEIQLHHTNQALSSQGRRSLAPLWVHPTFMHAAITLITSSPQEGRGEGEEGREGGKRGRGINWFNKFQRPMTQPVRSGLPWSEDGAFVYLFEDPQQRKCASWVSSHRCRGVWPNVHPVAMPLQPPPWPNYALSSATLKRRLWWLYRIHADEESTVSVACNTMRWWRWFVPELGREPGGWRTATSAVGCWTWGTAANTHTDKNHQCNAQIMARNTNTANVTV